eukprot:evm.model.scf_129.10 EVM.evm.TU.scf_129.10   scf_129:102520-105821(+)
MAHSFQLAFGLAAASRAPVPRVQCPAGGTCTAVQPNWLGAFAAAKRRPQPVCVSSSQFVDVEDDGDEDPVEIAEVEALLAGEDDTEEEGATAEPASEEPVIEAAEGASDAEEEKVDPASLSAPGYELNFLWLDRNVAVAVDQVFSKGQKSPLTEYFFWPRNDAWEELKTCLEGKPWIQERDRILLLNKTTEVINYWQDEQTKHSIQDAQAKFPDCSFFGA